MYFLYSLLLTTGLIAASPLLLWNAIRKGKYITGLSERFGILSSINPDGRSIIWLHCVSVGETTAARTLVKALAEKFPSHRLAISTTTVTGQKVAHALFANEAAAIFYFPIDWRWTMRRVLRTIEPSAVLIMETELWPRLFRECRMLDIPVFLLNGRISNRSFRRYKLARTFMRRVVNDLSLAFMQSAKDAERICLLGMDEARVSVAGNLKFDAAGGAGDETVTAGLRRLFRFDQSVPLIVAASTHDPEESVIIEAFKRLRQHHDARLMIVPRHPERFETVALKIEQSGFPWSRRSENASAGDAGAEIVLLDSIGELSSAYALADVAFVGGSIAAHGGHNTLEPAALGVCIISGAHTENFIDITRALLHEKAMIQLPDLPLSEAGQRLASILSELMADETKRREIGRRAQAVCLRNRGATDHVVAGIGAVLNQSSRRPAISASSLPASAFK